MLLELQVVLLLLSPFLMPKQEVHSLRDTCLSLSASHSWKKREVQCSMGTSGTRSGANSEWDRNLRKVSFSYWSRLLSPTSVSVVWCSSLFNIHFAACCLSGQLTFRSFSHFKIRRSLNVGAGAVRRACQRGADPAERTASALGRCTCCSSSQSPEPAAPQSGRRRADASRSQRFSSPAEEDKKVFTESLRTELITVID